MAYLASAVRRAQLRHTARMNSALALVAALATVDALPNHRNAASTSVNQTRRMWGPASLEDICNPTTEVCHRYAKVVAPLDHDDASQGSHEIAYFVNSDFCKYIYLRR